MAAVEVMDGATVRRWFQLAAEALASTRAAIDLLNVFPVPDADTGTNLHATITSAAAALADLPPHASPADIWQAASAAALRGACGNSGIIVSQLLRGLAETCGPASPCDGAVVAVALANAAAAARAAVRRPVEGTVLTVADAAARAAARASSLAEVGHAAAAGAREALAATRQQIGDLAASGVVDAGGAGLCVLLDALSAAVSGVHPAAYVVPEPVDGTRIAAIAAAGQDAADRGGHPAATWRPGSPHAYEVTFLLDAAGQDVTALADRLDQLGDSLVISGGSGQWHVHVHVADAGAVVEAGIAAGRPSKITITYLNGSPVRPALSEPASDGGIVAVVDGAGLRGLLGAVVALAGGALIAADGPDADPAAALARLAAGQARRTLIAPAGLAGTWPDGWPVVEIGSQIQAIAALAVHDPGRDQAADVAVMRRAVAGMSWASIEMDLAGGGSAVAGQDGVAAARGGHAERGGCLVGRAGGETVATGPDQRAVTAEVIGRLLGPGAELVTIVTGAEAGPGLGAWAAERAATLAPAAEVTRYDGGMPATVLLIGVE